MVLKYKLAAIIALLSFGFSFSQVISYLSPNGKVLSEEMYIEGKKSSLENVKKQNGADTEIYERLELVKKAKDSLLYSFRWEFLNPELLFEMKKTEAMVGKKIDWQQLNFINAQDFKKLDPKKPTFVNFWFITCPPCLEEMPALNELKEKYGDKMNFISITFEKKEKVEKFLQKRKFNFTHAVDSKKIIDSFEITGYPKSFILDRNQIIKHFESALPEKEDSDFYQSQMKLVEDQIKRYL